MENTAKDNSYYSQDRGELLAFVPPGVRKVLDVGCGEASFTQSVKKAFNAEAWGLEMVAAAADIARSRLDQVLVGSFDDRFADLPQKYFDCIFFNDVLEHMENPERVLSASKKLLSEEGAIMCSIPNVRFFPNLLELLIKKDWRYRDGGVLDRTHLRFFTLKSIERLFADLGFEIVKISGINPIKSHKAKLLYGLINTLTLGFFADTQYMQFACVIKPRV